jgi:hypothetical protein
MRCKTLESTFVELAREWLSDEVVRTGGKRRCVFTAALTVWLMIAQKVIGRGTLSKVLQLLQRGLIEPSVMRSSGTKGVPYRGKLSNSTGGLSRARSRVTVKMIEELSDLLYERATEELSAVAAAVGQASYLFKGRAVYVQDGSTVALPNTAELRARFAPCKSGHGEHFPMLRFVTVHHLTSGVALRPEYDSLKVSEQELARRLYKRLEPSSLLLGDENFGVFSTVFGAQEEGHHVLVRLQEKRASKILTRLPPSGCDERVVWTPSRADRATTPCLPHGAELKGRLLCVTLYAPGFRTTPLYFFTTALDLSVDEVVKLYSMRVRIETDIRHFKRSLELDSLTTKSVEMVEKEFLLAISAYNLIRVCIARGAALIGVEPRRVSFTKASEFFQTLAIVYLKSPKSKSTQKELYHWYLKGLRQVLLPERRKTRIEPRKLARAAPRDFPAMTKSRKEERLAIVTGEI